MQIWGNEKKYKTDHVELEEVCLEATPDELRILSDFLLHIAEEIEKYGDKFDHEHFQDYCKRKNLYQPFVPPDLIVVKAK